MFYSRRCPACGMWHVYYYTSGRPVLDNDELTLEQRCTGDIETIEEKYRKAFLTKKDAEKYRSHSERGYTGIDRHKGDYFRGRK